MTFSVACITAKPITTLNQESIIPNFFLKIINVNYSLRQTVIIPVEHNNTVFVYVRKNSSISHCAGIVKKRNKKTPFFFF